jgi:hypothetical protein
MQTERDAEIVSWVGRLGAAGAEHVAGRFQMGRSQCYERLEALTRDGLLEQRALLHRRPGLYLATRAGLRWRGLGRLGVHRVNPGGYEHAWQLAATALALHRLLPGWRVLSDREIRAHERDERQLLASARLGRGAREGARVHRPDLALIDPQGRVSAVEVELSQKARARLQEICTGWARARHIQRVYYLAAPAAAGALTRAVGETRSQEQVRVLALADTPTLAKEARDAAA